MAKETTKEAQDTATEEQKVKRATAPKALPMAELMRIVLAFQENPEDMQTQIKLIDAMRRMPLVTALLLSGNTTGAILLLPPYMTGRKVNDQLIRYDKKKYVELHHEIVGSSEGADGEEQGDDEDEQDTVDVVEAPAKQQQQQQQPPQQKKQKVAPASGAASSEQPAFELNLDDLVTL